MDLIKTKEKLSWPLHSAEYRIGVTEFITYATRDHLSSGKISKIWCPCETCANQKLLSVDEVYYHLLHFGIKPSYSTWNFHGESLGESSNSSESQSQYTPETHKYGYKDDNLPHVDETMQDANYPPFVNNSTPNIDASKIGPNKEAKAFYSLLSDADKELWPGCELTKLSFLVLLFHTKSRNKWSNKSISDLLGILQLAIPNGKSLPKSFSEAKKVIEKLGLGYQKIHACPNHCQLFWKDKVNDDVCAICGASRWKNIPEQTTEKKKKKGIAAKVLRYFPLKPRLKRLFMSKHTSSLMRWHAEERESNDGVLGHPADSEAWKSFDKRYSAFGAESRNVRLGLASDGFNPFGMLNSTYSCWPVVLIPYNLPPSMCCKDSSLILSTLIPGPTSPGNKIDVYLQPLLEELIDLWSHGTETYDASKDETFQMHVGLLWTISDFPAYGMLSGWALHGKNACPCCNSDTESKWLKNGHKFCFMGHRRFLPSDHHFRTNKEAFNGKNELREAPNLRSGVDDLNQIREITDFDHSNTWKKESIFFKLPYWESHEIRHNLDVMHIEKNVCDNIIGTLLNLEGKTKDNLNARRDLKAWGIREELHPQERGSSKRMYLPPPPYTMSRSEKQAFYRSLHGVKVPNGYASNISRCVNLLQNKLHGLKSHDCHILMQQLLPVSLQGLLPKDVLVILFDLCGVFRDLCEKNLKEKDVDDLEVRIPYIMCHLEMIFPPGFFTIMVHLITHLAKQAKVAGPVQFRWMYFVERYLGKLKSYVRNKAHPEGSIAESYLADECMNFCSLYLKGFEKFKIILGIAVEEVYTEVKGQSSIFAKVGKPLGNPRNRKVNQVNKTQAHRYILFNSSEVKPFLEEHATQLKRQSRPRRLSLKDIERIQHNTFHEWFREHVMKLELAEGPGCLSEDIRMLARGPLDVVKKYRGYHIKGFKFRCKTYDKCTQNSGVVLIAKTSSYSSASDRNPQLGDFAYYGRLTEIVELQYLGGYSVMLFKCEWVDPNPRRGIKKDEYGFTLVNFSRLMYTGERLEHEPYILATQVDQVFYVTDQQNTEWAVALKLKPKGIYDLGDDCLTEDQEDAPYHVTFLNDQGRRSWVRQNVEGTIVDV